MAKRWWWMAVLALCAGVALAGGRGAVRKQIESTMLVEGTIDVNADGSVAGFDLQRRDTLQPEVLQLIAQAVPAWRFRPLALEPGMDRARADMSIRLVAKKLDDGGILVGVRGAQFRSPDANDAPRTRSMPPPRYPRQLVAQSVGGTVLVLLKVGRDGRVADLAAEQVNLRVVGTEGAMRAWRDQLAQVSLATAKTWTFEPPTHGPAAGEAYWVVRVPVDFYPCVGGPGTCPVPNPYGWHAYVPGPRQRVSWAIEGSDVSADAIASGRVQPIDSAFQLLTRFDAS